MNATFKEQVRDRRGRPHIVFGLALVLVGTAFLAENLDIHWFDNFWNWWPVLFIAIGAAKLTTGRADERTFGAVVLFLGVVFFGQFTLGLDVHVKYLWPVILIIIGGSIVYHAIRGPQPPDASADIATVVRERALLGGISRKNTSQCFQGGELTAFMGGCEIDLRDARMGGPQAVIDCFTMWGGIEITVPRDWVVEPQVSVLAAGFDDRTTPPVQPVGRLVIRGTAVMAGIEVKN